MKQPTRVQRAWLQLSKQHLLTRRPLPIRLTTLRQPPPPINRFPHSDAKDDEAKAKAADYLDQLTTLQSAF